jgi:hypothetical protein
MRTLLLASLFAVAGGCATVNDGPATPNHQQAEADALQHMRTATPPSSHSRQDNLSPFRDGMGPGQPPGPGHAMAGRR